MWGYVHHICSSERRNDRKKLTSLGRTEQTDQNFCAKGCLRSVRLSRLRRERMETTSQRIGVRIQLLCRPLQILDAGLVCILVGVRIDLRGKQLTKRHIQHWQLLYATRASTITLYTIEKTIETTCQLSSKGGNRGEEGANEKRTR